MLRVGLTGGLGSGKSTVAEFLRGLGAHVIEADAIGRRLMEPGEEVYRAIVEAFGPAVVLPSGRLDRDRLAALAFDEGRLHELNGIVHPPVVRAQESWARELFAVDPAAVAVVESALIFEASRGEASRGEASRGEASQGEESPGEARPGAMDEAGPQGAAPASSPARGSVPGWRRRFDSLILVTAPNELKVRRYVERLLAGKELTGDERSARESALRTDALRRLHAQIPDSEKVASCDYVLRNDTSVEELRKQTEAVYRELAERSRREAAGLAQRRPRG